MNSSSTVINRHINCIKVIALQNVSLFYTKINYQKNFRTSKEMRAYKILNKINNDHSISSCICTKIKVRSTRIILFESTIGICFQKKCIFLFATIFSLSASCSDVTGAYRCTCNVIKSIKILATSYHMLACDTVASFENFPILPMSKIEKQSLKFLL